MGFQWHIPSDRSMALGSTQPLVKMSTRNIPGGKGGRCVRLTSSPSCAECHEIWKSKPPGTLWATPGLLRDSFTFTRWSGWSTPHPGQFTSGKWPGTEWALGPLWNDMVNLAPSRIRSPDHPACSKSIILIIIIIACFKSNSNWTYWACMARNCTKDPGT